MKTALRVFIQTGPTDNFARYGRLEQGCAVTLTEADARFAMAHANDSPFKDTGELHDVERVWTPDEAKEKWPKMFAKAEHTAKAKEDDAPAEPAEAAVGVEEKPAHKLRVVKKPAKPPARRRH